MLCQKRAGLIFFAAISHKIFSAMPTLHLTIRGKVQGVYYRASAKEKAGSLGVNGWVKNTKEGHVEAMVSGPLEQVLAFVDWCRQGPSGAVVTAVEVEERQEEDFGRFRILRD